MAKNVSAGLASVLGQEVTDLVVIIEIRRDDGIVYRLTSHDTPLTVDGLTYSNDVPFTLSAVQASSQLAVDTCEMEIGVDGSIITDEALRSDLFKNGAIEISQVSWKNLSAGKVTLRKGWFNRISVNRHGVAKFEVGGLLKVLDLSVGRVYQPSCDTDLGSKRCRVAIDLSQAYSSFNRYVVGDWVYAYDRTAMSALTSLINPSFEDDGPRAANQAITGWTKSTNAFWRVNTTSIHSGVGLTPADGTYLLEGTQDVADLATVQTLSQTCDLAAGGVNVTNVDAGRIVFIAYVKLANTLYLLDSPRIMVEILDASGAVLDSKDTSYRTNDVENVWREKAFAFQLPVGARSVRITLFARRDDGDVYNIAFDGVEMYHYDWTLGTPYDGFVHRVSRVASFGSGRHDVPLRNSSFELLAPIANSAGNVAGISGDGGIPFWTKEAGDFWAVQTNVGGQPAPDGSYLLVAGDNASGVQETYSIYGALNLTTTPGLDIARVQAGKATGRLTGTLVFAGSTGRASVEIQWRTQANAIITTQVVMPLQNPGGAGSVPFSVLVPIPATAYSFRIYCIAETPAATSVGNVGFDAFTFEALDAERVAADDDRASEAVGVPFDYTTGSYTVDGQLIWNARAAHLQYDTVASATDRKNFVGTTISGGDGAYETAAIRWLSGANTGSRNVIRTWNSGTKAIRLYFPCAAPIAPGDRYEYVRSCQKRFLEDCVAVFSNAINFQGFPYLPGKLE